MMDINTLQSCLEGRMAPHGSNSHRRASSGRFQGIMDPLLTFTLRAHDSKAIPLNFSRRKCREVKKLCPFLFISHRKSTRGGSTILSLCTHSLILRSSQIWGFFLDAHKLIIWFGHVQDVLRCLQDVAEFRNSLLFLIKRTCKGYGTPKATTWTVIWEDLSGYYLLGLGGNRRSTYWYIFILRNRK
jgi:hypothetical protein